MNITDVAGLKAAIDRKAQKLKYGTWIYGPLSKTAVFAIIDRFVVEEPVTVRSIVANETPLCKQAMIVLEYIRENGFDGLWNENGEPACGCSLNDFCPNDGCPFPDCRPAYKHRDGLMYLEEES